MHDYARIYGPPTVVFRMSCIYGTRQFGTEDQGWVAHFARCMQRGEPVTIYGDGCQVRDILWIDDLVRALAERREPRRAGAAAARRGAAGRAAAGAGHRDALTVDADDFTASGKMLTATDTMKAARLAGPGELRFGEVPLPEPGAGQVRIRLEGCGVCASNLTPWGGAEWMQ